MSYEDLIADRLRAADYDITLLTVAERVELSTQARKCGIQIWHRGLAWPSNPSAHVYLDRPTDVDPRRY